MSIKVYLAGRIKVMSHHSLGRFGVVDPSIEEDDATEPDAMKFVRAMFHETTIWSSGGDSARTVDFQYTGPFTVSNDHGSAHFRTGGWDSETGQHRDFGFGTGNHGSYPPVETSPNKKVRQAVLARALSGIENCDAFIAWIEDEECFGTIAEIGYAKALGKPIFIGLASHIRPEGELWFALQMATKVYYHDPEGTESGTIAEESVAVCLDSAAQHLYREGKL